MYQTHTQLLEQLGYLPKDAFADEIFTPEGQINRHWLPFFSRLANFDREHIIQGAKRARRLLRDDGATFNILQKTQGDEQAWPLDPVPRLLDDTQWQCLSKGLTERVELFNLLLKDLYTERTVIREKCLPPRAIFTHPGFLRACQQVQMDQPQPLFFHCTDLIRDGKGNFLVVNDAMQQPKGLGYTLENRTILYRTFPELFRTCTVKKLGAFYYNLQRQLIRLTQRDELSGIAVLSKGSSDAAYFEQGYLANSMGLPLVRGDDLLVRENRLWMKTFDGLKRIDVLLRFIDDPFCDPVELRSDSTTGVSGLLNTVRAGNLTIANPIGCGILENPVLAKYWGGICKHFLDKDPAINSPTTYWCHDPQDLDYVTAHMDQLIIKPVLPGKNFQGICGSDLTEEDRKQLTERIKRKPGNYVAQAQIEIATTPAFVNNLLKPRPSTLRTFAIAGDSGYTLLPGGLSQISPTANTRFIRLRSDALSKDTWIIAPDDGSDIASLQPLKTDHIQSSSPPSRVVENLYATGRLAERAEMLLRFLRIGFRMMHSEESTDQDNRSTMILRIAAISSRQQQADVLFKDMEEKDPLTLMHMLLNDPEFEGSMQQILQDLIGATESSKELLSLDSIRIINNIRDAYSQLNQKLHHSSIELSDESLTPLLMEILSLTGMVSDSMQGIGFHFHNLGKRIERLQWIMQLIDSFFETPTPFQEQEITIKTLLLSFELFITYKRRYPQSGLPFLLELMLLDKTNPRSAIFQILALTSHLESLPLKKDIMTNSLELKDEQRLLLECKALIQLADMQDLSRADASHREPLGHLCKRVLFAMNTLDKIINEKYFEHSLYPTQLVSSAWSENTWSE